MARTLAAGQPQANEAALVKDLGTRFEQDSGELAADLLSYIDDAAADRPRLAELVETARLHSPLFTLRGGTNEVLRGMVAKGMGLLGMSNILSGGVFASSTDDFTELRDLADSIGRESFDAAIGHRSLPTPFRRRRMAPTGGCRPDSTVQHRRLRREGRPTSRWSCVPSRATL